MIARKAAEVIRQCKDALSDEYCQNSSAQTLAYYLSLCLLFVWADRGIQKVDPMLKAYAPIIDQMSM